MTIVLNEKLVEGIPQETIERVLDAIEIRNPFSEKFEGSNQKGLSAAEITNMAIEMFFDPQAKAAVTEQERKAMWQKVRRTLDGRKVTPAEAELMLSEEGELHRYFAKKGRSKNLESGRVEKCENDHTELDSAINQATIETMLNVVIHKLYDGGEFDVAKFKRHLRKQATEKDVKPENYERLCHSQKEIWSEFLINVGTKKQNS